MANTITVTTVATKLADSSAEDREVRIHNRGAGVLFVSKSGALTSSDGYQIAAGAEDDFTLEAGEQLFALVASGSAPVDVV